MVRCINADSSLPNFMWGELMVTAEFLENRWPHAALKKQTLYKLLHGKEASLHHLGVIGARVFVHVEAHTKKLDAKT